MRHSRRTALSAAVVGGLGFASGRAIAEASRPAPQSPAGTLFAVELRTGPGWDAARAAHEQAHFREHSANLKRLRQAGQLLVGARYGDKGFLVLMAESEAAARALIDADPSVQSQVFAYALQPLRVFYAGCVPSPQGA